MNSCGICISNGSSANLIVRGEPDLACHSPIMRAESAVGLSSQWNCSGRLSSQLQSQFKDEFVSICESEKHNSLPNQKHLSCSCRLSEKSDKIRSAFPTRFRSYVREWLSQIFDTNTIQEDTAEKVSSRTDPQPCIFGPVLLDYDSEKCLDTLSTFNMQSLERSKNPFASEEPTGQFFTAQALAEMAITDLVSTIPSVNALQTVPYFDLLQNNLIDISQFITDRENELGTDSPDEQVQYVTPEQFGSPEALALWLDDRLPYGISHWGTSPGTKRVANLWIELKEGEIMIQDAYPPKRTVHVASVKIKNQAGQMLVEAHQEMADGSIRLRNRPLSEKMRPGENIESACFRGIAEELGCQLGARSRVRIMPGSYKQKLEERESVSYPGLLTSYIIHSVEVTVDDLPDAGFYTVEDENSGDHSSNGAALCGCTSSNSKHAALGVRKHFWRWVPQHP